MGKDKKVKTKQTAGKFIYLELQKLEFIVNKESCKLKHYYHCLAYIILIYKLLHRIFW